MIISLLRKYFRVEHPVVCRSLQFPFILSKTFFAFALIIDVYKIALKVLPKLVDVDNFA